MIYIMHGYNFHEISKTQLTGRLSDKPHLFCRRSKHLNSDDCITKLFSNDSDLFFSSENALTFLGDTVSLHRIPGNLAIEKCCLL